MDAPRCLALAQRMDALLQQALGCGVDAARMVRDPLYARDVLLVCEAQPGSALAALAQAYRHAAAPPTAPPAPPPAGAPAAAGVGAYGPPGAGGRPGPRPPTARTPDRAPAGLRDSGWSSLFGWFRLSAPASLPPDPPGSGATGPEPDSPDSPDTWPPGAAQPLDGALDRARRPGAPAVPAPPRPAPPGRRAGWVPARWFARGTRGPRPPR